MSSQLELAFDLRALEAQFADDLTGNMTTLSSTEWLLTEAEVILTLYVPPIVTALGLLGKLNMPTRFEKSSHLNIVNLY